jgi:hypothetical protein
MSVITSAAPLRGRTPIALAVTLVVVVLTGVLTVVNAIKLSHDTHAANSPRGTSAAAVAASATTAMAEGGQIAVDFTSFNYQTLTADLNRTANRATPAFAKIYLAQSHAVSSLIEKAKAVSIAQIVATGLQSFSPTKHTATVIVALNDTTKNTKTPAGSVQYFRMLVQLVNQNGVWLASQVTPE